MLHSKIVSFIFFIVHTSLTATYNLAAFQFQQRIDLNGNIQYETLTILLHYFYHVINIRDTWQTLISCFFFSFPRCSCLFFSLSFLDFLLWPLSNTRQRLLRVSFPDFPFSRDSQLCNTCIFHRFSRVSHSVSRLLKRVLIFRYFSAPFAGFFLVSSFSRAHRSWKNIFHRLSLSNDGASPRLNVDIENSSIAHTCTNISARKINKFLIVARHSRERITRLPSTSFSLLCTTLEPFDTSVFLLFPFFDHRQPDPFVFTTRVSTRYAEFGNSLTIFR